MAAGKDILMNNLSKHNHKFLFLIAVITGIILSFSTFYADETFPQRQGLINDYAHVLSAAAHREMEARANEVLQKTGTTIAVAIISTLGNNYTSDYANRLYRHWGIGKKGVNKGVLVFLAVKERKIRIETGYGVEGILPDGKVGTIIRNDITPYLKTNDYDTALTNAVKSLAQVIADDAKVTLSGFPEKSASQEESAATGENMWDVIIPLAIIFGLFGLIFLFVALFGKRRSIGSDSNDSSRRSVSSDSGNSSDSSDSGFDGGDSGGGGAESDY
jgi:uncharacterized protein